MAKKIKKKFKTILEINKKISPGFLAEFGLLYKANCMNLQRYFRPFSLFGRCQLRVVGANLSILTHIIMTQKCMTRQKYPDSQSEHLQRLISKDFQKISHKTNQLSEFTPKIFSLIQDSFLPNVFFRS